jgi:hypothetical protein
METSTMSLTMMLVVVVLMVLLLLLMDRQSGEEEVVVGTDQSDVAAAKAYRRLFSEQTPPSSDLSMMEQEAMGSEDLPVDMSMCRLCMKWLEERMTELKKLAEIGREVGLWF